MPKRSWKPSVCTLPESVYKVLSESFKGHEYDKAVLLTYRVYSKYLQNELSLSESYNIPSDYYRKVLGTAYRSIFIKLIKLGVFVKTKNYGVNQGIANHYCFGIEHQESPPIWVNYAATHRRPTQFEELVIKQLNKITIQEGYTPEIIIEELFPIHEKEIKSRIDEVNKVYKSKKKKKKKTPIEGDVQEFISNKISILQKTDYDTLIKIQKQNSNPRRNKTNARLDHVLTNASNRIIKYLRYNGEKITIADLGSSQFCLLANISLQIMRKSNRQNDHCKENQQVLKACFNKIRNKKPNKLPTVEYKHGSNLNVNDTNTGDVNTYIGNTSLTNTSVTNTSHITYNVLLSERFKPTSLPTSNPNPMMLALKNYKYTIGQQNVNDLVPFFKSSIEGRLYKEISVMLGLADRDEGKKACFELLFGRMVSEGQIRIESAANIPSRGRLFREAFPTIFEVVNSFKFHYVRLQGQVRHKVKKGSRIFPIFLQQMESFIFIDNILPTLLDKEIDCLTKHDSFLFPESQYQAAIDIVFNEMKKFLPFGFTLKIEQDGAGIDIKKYIIPGIEIENVINEYFGIANGSYKQKNVIYRRINIKKLDLPFDRNKLIDLVSKRRDVI